MYLSPPSAEGGRPTSVSVSTLARTMVPCWAVSGHSCCWYNCHSSLTADGIMKCNKCGKADTQLENPAHCQTLQTAAWRQTAGTMMLLCLNPFVSRPTNVGTGPLDVRTDVNTEARLCLFCSCYTVRLGQSLIMDRGCMLRKKTNKQ